MNRSIRDATPVAPMVSAILIVYGRVNHRSRWGDWIAVPHSRYSCSQASLPSSQSDSRESESIDPHGPRVLTGSSSRLSVPCSSECSSGWSMSADRPRPAPPLSLEREGSPRYEGVKGRRPMRLARPAGDQGTRLARGSSSGNGGRWCATWSEAIRPARRVHASRCANSSTAVATATTNGSSVAPARR